MSDPQGSTYRSQFRVPTTGATSQINDWKNQLLERAASVFGAESASAPPVDLKELHAKIGQLALENDFLSGALTKAGMLSAKR
jgi:transposase